MNAKARSGRLSACARVLLLGLWAGGRAAPVLVSLLAVSPARSESLALVTGDDYLPYTASTAPEQGVIAAVVRRVFALAGDEVQINFQPWETGFQETRAGIAVATFPYIKTVDRQADFLYSAPLYQTAEKVISAARAPLDPTTASALSGKKLCRPMGFGSPAALQSLVDQGQVAVQSPRELAGCINLLAAGRVDFLTADPAVFKAQLHQSLLEPALFHIADFTLGTNTAHLIIARSRPDGAAIIARFDAALARFKTSGDYGRLLDAAGIAPAGD